MVFVDGSNLLVELSKRLEPRFPADEVPGPAVEISRELIQRKLLAVPQYDLVRLYWFGSFTGDDTGMLDARKRLRRSGFEPLLFKKEKKGREKAVVMALVGHESAAMSHRYTHVGKEALERAAGALPEI